MKGKKFKQKDRKMNDEFNVRTRGSLLAEKVGKMGGPAKGLLKFLLVVAFVGSSCTCKHYNCVDSERSREVLENEGSFTNIEFKDTFQWWTCGGDSFATGFTATNAKGKRAEGTVCCGLFQKDCTIRW